MSNTAHHEVVQATAMWEPIREPALNVQKEQGRHSLASAKYSLIIADKTAYKHQQ